MILLRNLLPLLLLGMLVQCKKEVYQPVIDSPLGQEITLSVNQQVRLYQGEGPHGVYNLTATLLVVEDQRCPQDANCIHEGYVRVKLAISKANQTEKNLVVCWGMCSPGENTPVVFTFDGQTYEATLKNVTPLPQLTTSKEQVKKASLVISAV
jgi:hypothetical protein